MTTCPRVLLTGFEPYLDFRQNASALCLDCLVAAPPQRVHLTTRVYPVDFQRVPDLLAEDLRTTRPDLAVHLGQSPHSAVVALEAFAINAGCVPECPGEPFLLRPDGPAAYRCGLPLARWAQALRESGYPVALSHHAGTYLCNAVYYWSCDLAARLQLATQSVFVHLPLDAAQVDRRPDHPGLAAETSAAVVRQIVEWFHDDLASAAALPGALPQRSTGGR